MAKFWNWVRAEAGRRARLVLSGVIDSGMSWYEDAVTPAQFAQELAEHEGEDIVVEINSEGGDVFAGWEIYNALRARSGGTRVLVTGWAASIASIVAMAADPGELRMCRLSMMMIHNPWSAVCGDAADHRDCAEVLELIGDLMIQAYMDRFAGTQEELRELMSAETCFAPQRAVELGLADAIEGAPGEEEERTVAAAMLGRYAALDVGAIRERLSASAPATAKGSLPRGARKRARPRPPAHDYLAEVDKILSTLTRAAGAPLDLN